jgi:hypothetical protein
MLQRVHETKDPPWPLTGSAFLYVAVIIRQWPTSWPEMPALTLHSPVVPWGTHTLCQVGRTVWKESPLSNKSSFWEHKAAGTLGVLLTFGPAASESCVSCVALKPQVWRQKAGSRPAAAAGDTLSKQRERAWSRGRGGWTLRGWFHVAIFFSFVALVFFSYLFSFVVFNSQALGKTWQRYPPGRFQSKRLLSTFTTLR